MISTLVNDQVTQASAAPASKEVQALAPTQGKMLSVAPTQIAPTQGKAGVPPTGKMIPPPPPQTKGALTVAICAALGVLVVWWLMRKK